MAKYIIQAAVVGIGARGHVIQAPNKAAAWEKFQRAYPQECIHLTTRTMEMGDA